MRQPGCVLALERERLGVVAFEEGDEQGQREEAVCAQLKQRRVIVAGERATLGVSEGEPGAALGTGAVQDDARLLGLPLGDGPVRILTVALHQIRIAVDRVQELVDQVLAHCASTAFGYQVK